MFDVYMNALASLGVMDTLCERHEDGRLWVGEGPKVKAFEQKLKDRFGFRHLVALNSGTAGLELALALAGVGPGDEVITTAQTCTATNMPILRAGAKCVFADIQYLTGNIDPNDIETRITQRTKAIMCVHWGGYPCDMDALNDIGERYNIPVIQDGAHALGATYHDMPIGVTSDYFMCSFQAIKQLTCGDGGMLAMLDEDKYHEARRRRWFGIDRENRITQIDGYPFWDQTEVGYKMHMNDISAAIGLGNFEDIDEILHFRESVALLYDLEMEGTPGVTLFERMPDRTSGNWLYTMHVERRDDFCRMMRNKDIEVSVVHIRNDIHTIFGPKRDDLPGLDRYEKTYISIPLHFSLSPNDVQRVIAAVRGGW